MKKLLSFLFVLLSFVSIAQVDEYYRKVDWKFYPDNVIQLTDSTYIIDAIPYDYNDPGSIARIVGSYVVDFVGHRYQVIDSTSTTITILDIYNTGQAPQTGQVARCYLSVGNGEADYIGSIEYTPLDESARWKLNGSDNELLWRHGIEYESPFKRLVLDTTYQKDGEPKGVTFWDDENRTISTVLADGTVLQHGQEMPVPSYNNTGSPIENGKVVYVNGRHGNLPTIALAQGNSDVTGVVYGLTTSEFGTTGDERNGYVTISGVVRGVKTNYTGNGVWGTTWQVNDKLYVSKTVAGQLTNVEPDEPHHSDIVGTVSVVGSVGLGSIDVNIIRHKTLEELSDVNGTDLTTTGQFPVWSNENGYFDFNYNINNYVPDSIFDNFNSAFRLWGGIIANNGNGTVAIAAGAGVIKQTEAGPEDVPTSINAGQGGKLYYVEWDAVPSLALTNNAYNYIFLDGTDGQIKATTNFYSISFTQDFTLGRAYVQAPEVVVRLCGTNGWNFNRRVQLFGEEVFPVVRAKGLMIAGLPNRQFSITSGILWAELVNRFSVNAYSAATTPFRYYYRNGSGGWTTVSSAQINNNNYDDGDGTLGILTANRYGVHWVYIAHDGSVHVVYGQGDYTLVQAENATPPTTLPGLIEAYATLVGKIIIQKNSDTFTEVLSPFTTFFGQTAVAQHNELGGLQGGEAGYYGHVKSIDQTRLDNFRDSIIANTRVNILKDGVLIAQTQKIDIQDSTGIVVLSTNDIANGRVKVSIRNTMPDQVVSLTGGGITSISGTYPNFTITSNQVYPSSGIPLSTGSSWGTSLSSNTAGQLLRRNAANNGYEFWTPTYISSYTETDPIFNAHTTKNIVNGTGFLKNNGSGTWSYDNNTYLTGNQTITLSGAVTGSGATAITTTMATPASVTGTSTNTGGTGAHTHAVSGLTSSNLSATAGITNAQLANSTISGISLGSNLNAITFNNSGSGSASGITYNGNLARTISYNTIGAEPSIATGTTLQYWRGDKTWQTLNTTAVAEGTNLYFTNARARAAISLTTTGNSGAATYSSSTGVLNIPNYTLAGLGYVAPDLSVYKLKSDSTATDGYVRRDRLTSSLATKENVFTKNTAFNKNFGTTAGTVLEGRTFGTAANSNTGDFIQNQNSSAQAANYWINGSAHINTSIFTGNTFQPTSMMGSDVKLGVASSANTEVVISSYNSIPFNTDRKSKLTFGASDDASNTYSPDFTIQTSNFPFEFSINDRNGGGDISRFKINSTGQITLSSLSGTGSRLVTVDNNGLLSATKKDSSSFWNSHLSSDLDIAIGNDPIKTARSIVGTGIGNDSVKLVNDVTSPAALSYYGTNAGGVKGYHALPSSGVISYTVYNETELINAWNDAITYTGKSIVIYIGGTITLTANRTFKRAVTDSKIEFQGVGTQQTIAIGAYTFTVNHLTFRNIAFTTSGQVYVTVDGHYASFYNCWWYSEEFYNSTFSLMKIAIRTTGTIVNNTGGIIVDGMRHASSTNSSINDGNIQPFIIQNTATWTTSQRLYVSILGVEALRNFDTVSRVLLHSTANVVYKVTGDLSWWYHADQNFPGTGFILAQSEIMKRGSIDDVRADYMPSIATASNPVVIDATSKSLRKLTGLLSGTNTGDFTLAPNSGLTSTGQTLLSLGTPSTLTDVSANSVSGSNHSHAITTYTPTVTYNSSTAPITVSGGKVLGSVLTVNTDTISTKGLATQHDLTSAISGISGNYIQNQNASAQTANMWISGTGQFGGNVTINKSTSAELKVVSDGFSIITAEGGAASQFPLFVLKDNAVGGSQWNIENGRTVNGRLGFYNSGEKVFFESTGSATFSGDVTATTAKFTNLTDGYIPYHVSDASGLANSNIYYDGTRTSILGNPNYTSDYTLRIANSTNSAKQLRIGYDLTLEGSYLQSTESGVANRGLFLNPNGGNLLIGTTTDNGTDKLQVNGTISGSNAILSNQAVMLGQLPTLSNLVTNTSTSTNNVIARFDGTTGKIIKNSSIRIDDVHALVGSIASNNLTSIGTMYIASNSWSNSGAAFMGVNYERLRGTGNGKYTLTTTNMSNIINMFSYNYDVGTSVVNPANEGIVEIDFNPTTPWADNTMSGFTYPSGFVNITFYNVDIAQNVKLEIYTRNIGTGLDTWSTVGDLTGNNKRVLTFFVSGTLLYAKKMRLTVSNPLNTNIVITSMEYFPTRGNAREMEMQYIPTTSHTAQGVTTTLNFRNSAHINTLTINPNATDALVATTPIQAATGKFTNLTDGYIPYHVSDALGLANSQIFDNGTNVGIGTTAPETKVQIGTELLPIAGTNKTVNLGTVSRYSSSVGLQYSVNGYYATTVDATDIFTQTGTETAKNFFTGIVSDLAYFNSNRFSIISNGAERFSILQNGNVGIGTTSPGVKLVVTQLAGGSVTIPALGANGGTFGVYNDNQKYGIIMGSLGSGMGWIQSQRVDGTATAYNLLLNPNGGNVGIGTTAPSTVLHLKGSDSKLTIQDSEGSFSLTDAKLVTTGSAGDGTARTDIQYLTGNTGNAFTISYGATPTERFRIDATGNVGIGTTSPAYKLDLTNSSLTNTNSIALGATNAGDGGSIIWKTQYSGYSKTSAAITATNEGNYFRHGLAFSTGNYTDFTTNATERMRIDGDGNVGIGTTAPVRKLQVIGNGSFTDTITAPRIKLTEGAVDGYVLTSDESGNGTWAEISQTDNDGVQTLSGTTVTWNVDNGLNAKITLTGATTITLSNLVAGKHGTLSVVNGGSTSYRITFAGYTIKVHDAIRYAANQVAVSGGTTSDEFTWYYNGDYVAIRGGLNLW